MQSDTETWTLVAGFLSATFVLPMIQQPGWSARTRALVTFGWAVAVGLVAAWLTGGFAGVHDARAAVSSVLLVLVSSIATYRGFAKPTGVAPAIEAATSPRVQLVDQVDVDDVAGRHRDV